MNIAIILSFSYRLYYKLFQNSLAAPAAEEVNTGEELNGNVQITVRTVHETLFSSRKQVETFHLCLRVPLTRCHRLIVTYSFGTPKDVNNNLS